MESSHHQHQRQGSRVRFAEEEPGLEVYHPQPPPPPRSHQARSAAAATAATTKTANPPSAVFWADDNEYDPNASQYTFYREGTPTPPEYEEPREKGSFAYGAATAAAAAAAGVGSATTSHHAPTSRAMGVPVVFPTFDPPPGSGQDGHELPSSKKWKYRWVIIIFATLFIITPIAVGAGLGVGLRKPGPVSAQGPSSASSAGDVTASVQQPSPTSSSTMASSSTVTSSTRRPSSTPQPTEILPDCPDGNNTLYAVPGSTKTFLRVCGIDYSGAGGATDLAHIYTDSMVECINVCASYDKCTGCGWGAVAGDIEPAHRCWMKNDLRAPHTASDDYCFGILQA